MTDVPVKALSEIEVKSEVSENDKILILDSVSEEARLASKDELKGDKGDKGDTGETGPQGAAATVTVGTTSTLPAGSSATVSNSGTPSAAVFNFGIPKGDKGDQGEPGVDGQDGADGQDGQDGTDGNGITSVTSSKVGKTTTVTMNFDEGDPFSFQVQDGADGQGSGDMIASVYDPNNKAADAFDYDNFINTPTLGTAASKNTGTSSGNVPVLDANGKLNTSVVPAVAITDTFTINSSSELTGLTTAEKGDIAICPSEGKTYILYDDPYSTAANWKLLPTPTDAVSSVNSKTGVVTLDADDISDSTTTNKFVTATEKSTWSGKQDALTLPATPTQGHLVTWGADNETLEDGGAVPTVPTDVSAFVNDAGYLTAETVVSGDSGVTYTIKKSTTAPSGAGSNTITLVVE